MVQRMFLYYIKESMLLPLVLVSKQCRHRIHPFVSRDLTRYHLESRILIYELLAVLGVKIVLKFSCLTNQALCSFHS